MALTTCPECNNAVSSEASKCPHCGYIFKTSSNSTMNFIKQKSKLISIILCCCAIVVLGVIINCNYLNQYEQLALKDCGRLKSMLRNPASFTLYDDILVYPDHDDYGDLVYINYGATNGYGTMVQSIAIFKNGTTYVGDYDDTRDDFSSQREYNQLVLARLPYQLDILFNNDYTKFKRIDSNKIAKKLA